MMLGASQAVLLGTVAARPATYDGVVGGLEGVVSYWKFQNDGTDEKDPSHTTDAVITGSPELHVETIVDLDRVIEGAAENGECIAWPGTSGNYAEVPHNAKHKTPQGTIVVTFQHDRLLNKSVLVAADRSAGGTATGPGGLSMEVSPEGAPRCFLRRHGDAAVVELLGEAGDVQVGQAYSLIFKWGPGGLSMTLWNGSGNPVRRKTDLLENGVTGTSPIRFGAWHTDGAAHDGPYGRVVWFDRRIEDHEEANLARARTISRTTEVIEPFPFVTVYRPTVQSIGRPSFNAQDPRAASVTDPMSGLEFFRLLPDYVNEGQIINAAGAATGFYTGRRTRHHAAEIPDAWNADGSVLWIPIASGTGGGPWPAGGVFIRSIDWRVFRVGTPWGGSYGWWDDVDPNILWYMTAADGRYYKFNVQTGTQTLAFQITGYTFNTNNSGPDRGSYCRHKISGYQSRLLNRNSDGALVVTRINLNNGTKSGDIVLPRNDTVINGGSIYYDNGGMGSSVSADGSYLILRLAPGNRSQAFTVPASGSVAHTDVYVSDTLGDPTGMRHSAYPLINGRNIGVGIGSGNPAGVTYWDMAAGKVRYAGGIPDGANPITCNCTAISDKFETYGAAGGATTGSPRYVMIGKGNGMWAVRLGPDDVDQVRHIGDPRCKVNASDDQPDPNMDPTGRFIVWVSNWINGSSGGGTTLPYITVLPPGWFSATNSSV